MQLHFPCVRCHSESRIPSPTNGFGSSILRTLVKDEVFGVGFLAGFGSGCSDLKYRIFWYCSHFCFFLSRLRFRLEISFPVECNDFSQPQPGRCVGNGFHFLLILKHPRHRGTAARSRCRGIRECREKSVGGSITFRGSATWRVGFASVAYSRPCPVLWAH